jgi:hypothetical protein
MGINARYLYKIVDPPRKSRKHRRKFVIPPEIMARDLMFAAPMNGWRLELKSTNWIGYWIVQLTSESHELVEMLITFDHLTAICTGMRACIDVADDPSQYPGATTMLQRVAVDLPTQVCRTPAFSSGR